KVDFVRAQGGMGGASRNAAGQAVVKVESQKLEDVQGDWPQGTIGTAANYYVDRPWQRWTIEAVPEAGGYLGGPYYKIVLSGTDRALTANADAEVEIAPSFTGVDCQLWRIDQLTDGNYRIMPKEVPGHPGCNYALTAIGDVTPSLAKFDFNSDNSKWKFRLYDPER
ncbi:MAG: RICIN domain-containing protein, partial [Bacteroidales bacterium]|nr:RICIN domain-containing protein [Bacteroidales bacterium]